jgi:hypothetical protein
MYNSLISKLILLLSLLHIVVQAAPEYTGAKLKIRQTTDVTDASDDSTAAMSFVMQAVGPTNPNDPQCLEYARTANLSTIGANSTLRSAYIQASTQGTLITSNILDSAIAKLPKLKADVVLNMACGNLSTVALTESANNFSQGIVGQFSGIHGNPQEIKAGPELLVIVGGIMLMFTMVWCFMDPM